MLNINNMPMLSENMVSHEVFQRLCNAVSFLKAEYPNTVTGLWYLERTGHDGELRVIIRTELKVGTTEYIYLEGRLSKILGGCILYDYTEDVLNADSHEDFIEVIKAELDIGTVYTLYLVG